MVRSIPRKLLIHTATYEEYIPGDSWTPAGFKPAVMLQNVRIDKGSRLTRNNTGEQILYNALLFYDAENSSADGEFEFKEQSKLTFNGDTMTVNKVNEIYAYRFHHYEVELI